MRAATRRSTDFRRKAPDFPAPMNRAWAVFIRPLRGLEQCNGRWGLRSQIAPPKRLAVAVHCGSVGRQIRNRRR